jgi:hypothetical protein
LAGMIATRGKVPHESMKLVVAGFLDERQVSSFDDPGGWSCEPTSRQRREVMKRVSRARDPLTFRDACTSGVVGDKFGEATTRRRKLDNRVRRGVVDPCPLLLVGLPPSITTFHEGRAALAEVQAAEDEDGGVASAE